VVATPVQQTGIEGVDEAHDNDAVGHLCTYTYFSDWFVRCLLYVSNRPDS
jgi:hypothetical protein